MKGLRLYPKWHDYPAPQRPVITLLAITGLTHKQSYRDIFALTVIKTVAVFLVIGFHLLTTLV